MILCFFRVAELTEQLNAEMTRADELENKYEDVEYDLGKTRMRNDKLEGLLGETQDKLSVYVAKDDGKQIKSQVELKNKSLSLCKT